jgi:hypothetical protein
MPRSIPDRALEPERGLRDRNANGLDSIQRADKPLHSLTEKETTDPLLHGVAQLSITPLVDITSVTLSSLPVVLETGPN